MSLVPAVTELMLAELLYLQYDSPTAPVYMYINSTGVQVRHRRRSALSTALINSTCDAVCRPARLACAVLEHPHEQHHRAANRPLLALDAKTRLVLTVWHPS